MSAKSLERHDAPDRAEPVQVGGRDLLAGEEHLASLVAADEGRQVRAGAEQADVDLRRAEAGIVGGDEDVAARGEGEAGAEGGPVDRTDDRHGDSR